jgi:hypothetical protein
MQAGALLKKPLQFIGCKRTFISKSLYIIVKNFMFDMRKLLKAFTTFNFEKGKL